MRKNKTHLETGADTSTQEASKLSPFSIKRKSFQATEPVQITQAENNSGNVPVTITSNRQDTDPQEWLKANESTWKPFLHQKGAVLFKGFRALSEHSIGELLSVICEAPLEYKERSSPRTQVGDKVYTSTDYPNHQSIFFHNENSYQASWPKLLMFYCNVPAKLNGRTPIASTQGVLNRLPTEIIDTFIEKKILYVRNFGPSHGMTWQLVFQVDDKSMAEAYCRENQIEYFWKGDDQLQTRSVRDAVLRHPETNQPVWFNHAAFFHLSTLGTDLAGNVLEYYGEDNLPSHTFYGDGTPIEDDVIETIRQAYQAESVLFDWDRGDILLVDNMLYAHSRETYEGERSIWVGMGDLRYSKDYRVSN